MPLTAKGKEVLASMRKSYGPESGERVFYAMKNKGTLTGVDSDDLRDDKDEVPIPADYGTKLDAAADAADKLMVRLGSYMDRNDGQMCNIADADVKFTHAPAGYVHRETKRGEGWYAETGGSFYDGPFDSKDKAARAAEAGEAKNAAASRERIAAGEKRQQEIDEKRRKAKRKDSDVEAERRGIEIGGKREMVR
jgi:hypothetical protein